jgi:hypothetical protein
MTVVSASEVPLRQTLHRLISKAATDYFPPRFSVANSQLASLSIKAFT